MKAAAGAIKASAPILNGADANNYAEMNTLATSLVWCLAFRRFAGRAVDTVTKLEALGNRICAGCGRSSPRRPLRMPFRYAGGL